jgi:hypothetical protein
MIFSRIFSAPSRHWRRPFARLFSNSEDRTTTATVDTPATPAVQIAERPANVGAAHKSPYEGLPPSRFWRTAAAETSPGSVENFYQPKFLIARSTRIATAGSCFAQHIGRHLKRRGFRILDLEAAPPGITPAAAVRFGYGIYSARYGNIYLARQLLQLVEEVLDTRSPADIVWVRNGKFFDALRPGVEPQGLDSAEEVLAHRKVHLEAVRRLLTRAELFVFTFGLTEGWMHRASGTVYPTAPGTIAGDYDPHTYVFKNFSFSEVLADFVRFRHLVRSVNPSMRFLVTVSPVPLTATADNAHVVTATTYSKSVLRAVCGELATTYDDIDYFPSYEVIASHWSRGMFYEPNLRNITAEGVDAVMRIFFSAHGTSQIGAADDDRSTRIRRRQQRLARQQGRRARQAEQEVCEEAILEAFNR